MARKHKKPRFATKQVPTQIEGVQNLRRSGASGKHKDRRTKRNRTRDAQQRRAIQEGE